MAISSSITLVPSTWLNIDSVPKLDNTTHIWAIELRKSPNYRCLFESWLSEREKNKYQRMLVDLKRDYQIQARGWLRWLLAQYTDTTADRISYNYGSLGKPYLQPQDKQVFFNATDSGDALVCAFSKQYKLGIDIETIPRDVKHSQIAQKKFTTHELQLLLSLPPADQNNAFLALWTRKEAYGKAIGLGIRYPMNEVNLCDTFNSPRYRLHDQHGQKWHLFQFANKNNVACLVSTQNHDKINFYQLNIDSLKLE